MDDVLKKYKGNILSQENNIIIECPECKESLSVRTNFITINPEESISRSVIKCENEPNNKQCGKFISVIIKKNHSSSSTKVKPLKTLNLIKNCGDCYIFRLMTGELILINFSEDEITVEKLTGEKIGEILLKPHERVIKDDYTEFLGYYITRLSMEEGIDKQYIHKGIGRTCLLYFKDKYGDIYAASILGSGPKPDDGSELVNDGVPFVEKMRKEGIIEYYPE
ncbi:MAG: hypothetical protein ACYCSQ_04895 [bacterium]